MAKEELRNRVRPALKERVKDMEQYEIVILGYPNWWGTMQISVFTFLESYDFSDKIIIPYCTNEGSGLGRSMQDLKRLCPKSQITEGTPIHGADVAQADREVEEIINILDFISNN